MDDHRRAKRIRAKLDQQLSFMRHSCDYFDDGDDDEALRIATCLRILFHDTRVSTSICKHLNLRTCEALTSSRGFRNWQDYLSQQFNPTMNQPIWTVPMLGDFFRRIWLEEWWAEEPVFVYDNKRYSRKLIMLAAANRDGGAHVDDELDHYYEVLSNGEIAIGIAANFTYGGAPPFQQGITIYPKNAHLALLRQFAHETFVSFHGLATGKGAPAD